MWDRDVVEIAINSQTKTTSIPAAIERHLDGSVTIEASTREYYIDVLEADANHDGGDLALALGIAAVAVALFAVALTMPVVGVWAAGLASLSTVGAFGLAFWVRTRASRRVQVLIRLYDMRRREEVSRQHRKWWRGR